MTAERRAVREQLRMGSGERFAVGDDNASQLGGPIVSVWDNLNTHLAAGMRQFIAEQDWLTVVQLHAYAPHLNPVEGIWSLIRHALKVRR